MTPASLAPVSLLTRFQPCAQRQMGMLLQWPPNRLAAVPLIQVDDDSVNVSLTWRIEVPRARVWQCITDADLLSLGLGELVSGRRC